MDRKSSVGQRVLNRRRRKRVDPDPYPDVFFVDNFQQQRQRASVSGSKKKKKKLTSSFPDNADVVLISSTDSDSESGSEDSLSGFTASTCSASSHKTPNGSVAADEEEQEAIHIVVDDEEDEARVSVLSDESERDSGVAADEEEEEISVSDLSSSSSFESESEPDDSDFEADEVRGEGSDFEDGGEGSDDEPEPRSTGKEPSFHSEKEKRRKKASMDGSDSEAEPRKEPSFDSDKEKRRKKKASMDQVGYESEPRKEVTLESERKKKASMEDGTTSRANHLSKGKRVMSNDDDATDPNVHEEQGSADSESDSDKEKRRKKKNKAEPGKEPTFESERKRKASMEDGTTSRLRKGKRVMRNDDHQKELSLRANVGEQGSSDSETDIDHLWAEMDQGLLSFHTDYAYASSLDNIRGNENDETHANEEEGSGNDETHANEEEESDETHANQEEERAYKVPEKPDSESEMDHLWAEMQHCLAICQIGYTSSFDAKRGNENDEAHANQATLCKHDYFLDEEIGWRCRLCSHVDIEIKDYIAPMGKFAAERWGNRSSYGEENMDGFGGIKFDEASTSNPQETSAQGTVWDLIPGIRKEMFEHQRQGFEFIWRNLAGTIRLDELKGTCRPEETIGCIVSHGPGTGKSKLALTFLKSFLAKFESCKPVIIAPAGMLLTWECEFRKWNIGVPFINLNEGDRMMNLRIWKREKSILGISYNLYEKLAGGNFVSGKGDSRKKVKKREETRKMLVELPTLLVLDEGHTPRNKRSQIWQALSKAQAQRRIILSGTPFQNNFEELYNIICLVRPKLARKIPSILIKSSSKRQTGSKKEDAIKTLKDLISPFVHHKGGILEKTLPGLRSCVVGFNPSDLLKELLVKIGSTPNSFKFEHKESLAAVHPSLLLDCGLSKEEESSIDGDMLQRLTVNPNEGAKTIFLVEFIRLCNALGEKVLVFSQFIDPLEFIVKQLCLLFGWSEDREVLLMHGQLKLNQRQALINRFNDPTHKSRVLIASIKACSEGINLIGASRVVLLDVVWNPSVVRQAISRAYRLGQKRIVYSYHLITRGTKEWEKYHMQTEKDRIAEMVFTSTSKESYDGHKSHAIWEDDVLDELVTHEKLKGLFEKVIYHPKESNLVERFGQ